MQHNAAKQKITVYARARAGGGIRKFARIHRMHEQAMQESMMLELCCWNTDDRLPVLSKELLTNSVDAGFRDKNAPKPCCAILPMRN